MARGTRRDRKAQARSTIRAERLLRSRCAPELRMPQAIARTPARRGQAADQVSVIHPGLHRVGPLAGNQASQGQESAQADAAARHAARMDLDAGGAQALAVDALIGQETTTCSTGSPAWVARRNSTDSAALPQARDHVQHAAAGRSWPRSRTASNSASHSDSTLARA